MNDATLPVCTVPNLSSNITSSSVTTVSFNPCIHPNNVATNFGSAFMFAFPTVFGKDDDKKNTKQNDSPTYNDSAGVSIIQCKRHKKCLGCGLSTSADFCVKCPGLGRTWFADICLKYKCTAIDCKFGHEGQLLGCTYCRHTGHTKRFCAHSKIHCDQCNKLGHWSPHTKVMGLHYICGETHLYTRTKISDDVHVWKSNT